MKCNPKKSLSAEIVLWLLIGSILPAFIILYHSTQYFNENLNHVHANKIKVIGDIIERQIKDEVSALKSEVVNMSTEDFFVDFMLKGADLAKRLEMAFAYISNISISDGMFIYDEKGILISANDKEVEPATVTSKDFEEITSLPFATPSTKYQVSNNKIVLYVCAPIRNPSQKQLLGIICEAKQFARESLETTKARAGLNAAYYHNKTPILFTTTALPEIQIETPANPFESIFEAYVNGELYHLILIPLPESTDRSVSIALLQSGKTISENTRYIQKVFLFTLTGIVGFAFLIAVVSVKRISSPISDVIASLKKIKEGDLTHRVVVNSQNEVGFLAHSFNNMTENLQMTTVSKEYMDSIMESLTSSLIVLSFNGKIETANSATCSLLGYDQNELIGQHMETICSSPEFKRGRPLLETWKDGNLHKQKETEYRTQNGQCIPVSFSGSFLVDRRGKRKGLICVAEDITEKKQAEQALRKFKNVIEETAEMIMITDSIGKIEYVNPSFERVTEYKATEVLGKTPHFFKALKENPQNYEKMWKTISSGGVWNDELISRKKSGAVYFEVLTISPVHDSEGKIVNFVAIRRDITEKKRIEEQLIQSEKLSSIGTFVSGVAHEINNPLTAILGYSQILLDDSSLTQDVRKKLELIAKQSQISSSIVKNLLKFSRKTKPGKKTVTINSVLESSLELYQYRLQKDGVEIHRELAQNLPFVLGDVTQLQQVFMNIIINAHHAVMKVGDEKKISIQSQKLEDKIRITVSNNGPHIPQDDLNKIFDPFYTTKKVGEGTGLGLSISYGIIQGHDGEITATNISNHNNEAQSGVSFAIELPILDLKDLSELEIPDSMKNLNE